MSVNVIDVALDLPELDPLHDATLAEGLARVDTTHLHHRPGGLLVSRRRPLGPGMSLCRAARASVGRDVLGGVLGRDSCFL